MDNPAVAPAAVQPGTAVLLASALLNGLVLLLFAWVYSIDVAPHALVLLWLGCVLPLAWVMRLPVLIIFSAMLFFIWVPLFAVRGLAELLIGGLHGLPVLWLLGGVGLFTLGGLHDLWSPMRPVARGLRLFSLTVVAVALYGLGFFSLGDGRSLTTVLIEPMVMQHFHSAVVALGAGGVVLVVVAFAARPWAPLITATEGPISLGLLGAGMAWVFLPLPASVYAIVFNALDVAMLGLAAVTSVRRRDKALLHFSRIGFSTLAASRVPDLLWTRLPPWALVGGAVVAGVACWVVLGAVASSAWRKLPPPVTAPPAVT